jgi:hypothetical protein
MASSRPAWHVALLTRFSTLFPYGRQARMAQEGLLIVWVAPPHLGCRCSE